MDSGWPQFLRIMLFRYKFGLSRPLRIFLVDWTMLLYLVQWGTDTPTQRLCNELVDSLAGLEEVHATHAQEKELLQARILTLEADLAKEKTENPEAIHKLTQLIAPVPSTSSAPPF